MKRFSVILWFALVLTGLTMEGCTQQPTPTQTTFTATSQPAVPTATSTTVPVAKDQNLVIGMPISPRILDPDDLAPLSMAIFDLMYNKLIRVGTDGRLVPDLAESWEMVNPTTWRFHLRKGVKFHNGEEFNAETVKFTIEWNMDAKNNRLSRRGVPDVAKVNIVDSHTVDVTTTKPVGVQPTLLTIVYLLPAKYYARVGAQNFNNAPVGTGPFEYVDWKRDEYIKLQANPEYWEGKPKLNNVEIKIIPEASSRVAALKAGEVNLVYQLLPEQVDTVKTSGFEVKAVSIGQSYVFGFGRETLRAKPLQDKRVRQAIQHAVDMDAIIKGITGGMARKLDGQMAGPGVFGYSPDVRAYDYDPEKAKQLLTQAGYAQGFT
ncbi:partial Heme-binding protein A, partial [Gammaproteobacteria bacterium]